MRISRVLAMTVLSLTPDSTGAAIALAQNFRPPSHVSELSKRPSRPMAQFHSDNLLEEASLTFVVSVCLADLEYTSACREVSLLEATKRLEQIYLDGYAMRRAAGSLKVWFPPRVERSEQLRFLREVEERAIIAVAKDLQARTDQSAASQMRPPGAYGEDASGQETAQRVRKWREDASMEARNGTNWSHDWSSRTHSYRTETALRKFIILSTMN